MPEQKKILIVEDNIDFAKELIINFEQGGFATLHVDNVDAAIKILHRNTIDGISLDVQLKNSLGINLLDKIYDGQLEPEQIPVIIVVSSFINPQVLRTLKSHRVLHYDKAAPGFNFTVLLDSFASLLSVAPRSKNKILNVPTDDNLKTIIRQKLKPYEFKVKPIAYARLVDGIYYTVLSNSTQKSSLTSIYEAMGLEFSKVYIGLRRLLREAFENEDVPTPADFIAMIADEIKKDLPSL